jgi:hypothetical protein
MKIAPLPDEFDDSGMSMTTANRPKPPSSRKLPASASKFFYVDAAGRYIDTELKRGVCCPRFASDHLERAYFSARLETWRENSALVCRVGVIALLAACSCFQAVAFETRNPALRTTRVVAGALACMLMPAFIFKNRLRPRNLGRCFAGVSVLTVSPRNAQQSRWVSHPSRRWHHPLFVSCRQFPVYQCM